MSFWDFSWLYKPAANTLQDMGEEAPETTEQRKKLIEQGQAASDFANTSQGNFGSLGVEAYDMRKRLADTMAGNNLVSAEQLRQGLQQNLAAQRSMAASAAPRDAAMAARTAAIQGGRLGYGLSGQAALAALQEKKDAQSQLANMIMGQRQQELQAALGSRDNAVRAHGGQPSAKSDIEKAQPGVNAGIGILSAILSDERAKRDIRSGDEAARHAAQAIEPKTFAYKNPANGNGRQLGVMAQDLEKAGLGHAVRDTPAGKVVDTQRLVPSLAAMLASQGKRIGELESETEKSKRWLGEKLLEARRR